MSFKLKKIFLVQFCLCILNLSVSAFGSEVKPSQVLNAPTSYLSAASGAGAAAPGDISMLDANPAILPALKKQYSVFGGTSWQEKLDLIEAGVFDSTTTPVAMALRARETIPSDTVTRDRSFTTAVGYQLPFLSNLSLGLSFEYQQLSLSKIWAWQKQNYRLGLGAFYQINTPWKNPIFLGASTKGLFDKYNTTLTDIGISTTAFENYFTFSLDGLIDSKKGFQSIVSGVNVILSNFFEFRGSLGYNPKQDRIFWGSGIFFKGPVLHLYYTLVKTDSDDTTLRQTAGLELAFSI